MNNIIYIFLISLILSPYISEAFFFLLFPGPVILPKSTTEAPTTTEAPSKGHTYPAPTYRRHYQPLYFVPPYGYNSHESEEAETTTLPPPPPTTTKKHKYKPHHYYQPQPVYFPYVDEYYAPHPPPPPPPPSTAPPTTTTTTTPAPTTKKPKTYFPYLSEKLNEKQEFLGSLKSFFNPYIPYPYPRGIHQPYGFHEEWSDTPPPGYYEHHMMKPPTTTTTATTEESTTKKEIPTTTRKIRPPPVYYPHYSGNSEISFTPPPADEMIPPPRNHRPTLRNQPSMGFAPQIDYNANPQSRIQMPQYNPNNINPQSIRMPQYNPNLYPDHYQPPKLKLNSKPSIKPANIKPSTTTTTTTESTTTSNQSTDDSQMFITMMDDTTDKDNISIEKQELKESESQNRRAFIPLHNPLRNDQINQKHWNLRDTIINNPNLQSSDSEEIIINVPPNRPDANKYTKWNLRDSIDNPDLQADTNSFEDASYSFIKEYINNNTNINRG